MSNGLFTCYICAQQHPLDFSHSHHKIPREANGPDTPENLVKLCGGCHSSLHVISSMMFNPTRAGLVEDWTRIHYKTFPDSDGTTRRALELASLVCKYKTLKSDGAIVAGDLDEVSLMVTLPSKYKQLLQLTAADQNIGMIKYTRILLLNHLRTKYPQFAEEITLLINN